jgi:uncharacterized protein (TIRG00374 family)
MPAASPEIPEDLGSASFVRRAGPRIVIGVVLAIVAVSGLALFGDTRDLFSALRTFPWWLIVPVLSLTLFNYALRFVKWQLYLRWLALPPIPVSTSSLVYFSGFSMSITPGKVGEFIKTVLLRRVCGAPISRTTAVIAAERLTDGMAMIILAAVGATQFSYARPFLVVICVGAVAAILFLQRPRLLTRVVERAERLGAVGSRVHHAAAFIEASGVLLQPRPLLIAIALGTISWGSECVAFFLVLHGLGVPATLHLLLVATFVLAVSSLVGAVSMLPGGLGIAEASVAGMLLILVDDDTMTRGVAAAATLMIRFATLWFAVILGVIALALLHRLVLSRGTTARLPAPNSNAIIQRHEGGNA